MNQAVAKKISTLRFPEFNDELSIKTFTDLYSFGNTNSFSRDKLSYEEGEIYNIHYGDIHTKFKSRFMLDNELVPRVIGMITFNNQSLAEVGDIIIADASEDYADIGKTIEIVSTGNKKILSGLHTILGKRKSKELEVGFICYLMQNYSQKLKIMRIAQGVKVLGLPKVYLKNLTFNIPQNNEQKKIASFLSSVDDWVGNLREQKKFLEKYKKGMMQKIFTQEIRFKDEIEKDFPEWEEKKLGDMLSMVVDNRGKTPPLAKTGIPLVEINAILNKYVDYSHITKYVTEDTFNNWFRKYLEQDDILFSTVGATALCSLFNGRFKTAVAQNIVGLRFKNDEPSFIYYLLTEKRNNHKFKRIEMGAVQPSVKVSQMIKIKFLLPSLPEQQKIAEFLSLIDQQIEAKDNQVKKAEDWKKGLLQQMFI